MSINLLNIDQFVRGVQYQNAIKRFHHPELPGYDEVRLEQKSYHTNDKPASAPDAGAPMPGSVVQPGRHSDSGTHLSKEPGAPDRPTAVDGPPAFDWLRPVGGALHPKARAVHSVLSAPMPRQKPKKI
jgi:hypothetical protein